jgi:hypothetical protein
VHPLRIGPSASFAAGVFAAGAVQTFVALAWLFDNLPRTAAVGTVRSAFRFVAFFAGLYLYVTVSKVQTAVRARRWTRAEALAAILMLALPWIVARVVVRPASAVWRWSWRGVGIQKASFWFSLVFVGQMIWYAVVVNERTTVRLSSAFPWWMVAGTLLGTGLIFAVFELNMPPTIAVGRVEAHVAIVGDLEPAADAGPIAPVPPVGGAPEQVRSDRTQER